MSFAEIDYTDFFLAAINLVSAASPSLHTTSLEVEGDHSKGFQINVHDYECDLMGYVNWTPNTGYYNIVNQRTKQTELTYCPFIAIAKFGQMVQEIANTGAAS